MGVENESKRAAAIVRKFVAMDVTAVMAIAQESPQASNWSRDSYISLAGEDGSLALVFDTDGEVTGFLIGRRLVDQAEVLNLAVQMKYRGKGQGTALLAAALEEFVRWGVKRVYLEVRESNTAAIAFYEHHGFAKTGLRKGYYRDPDEPAITMQKELTG
ncbi:MAG TPA: ribosomal protein S18-alanine N-acetyltransferase [Candidatus Acidoferrum sp.]